MLCFLLFVYLTDTTAAVAAAYLVDDLQGKRCMVSGSGNVAQYAAKKLIELGGVVLTMSDSTGYVYEPNGFTAEQIEQVMHIKNTQRTTLAAYKSSTGEQGLREAFFFFWAFVQVIDSNSALVNMAACVTMHHVAHCVGLRIGATLHGDLVQLFCAAPVLPLLHRNSSLQTQSTIVLTCCSSPAVAAAAAAGQYVAGERCWNAPCNADIALPCATQVRAHRGQPRSKRKA
jgi:hypothetical protein